MRYWLMKTEPETFSFDDLLKASKRTTSWEGVRNFQARNLMRDEMKLGDTVFFYHSSCDVPGIVGVAEVVREAHPDQSALDPKSEYFDAKLAAAEAAGTAKDTSRWMLVDVKAKARLKVPMTLELLRGTPGLEDMMVLKRGMRLSVQPVTAGEAKIVLKRGKPDGI